MSFMRADIDNWTDNPPRIWVPAGFLHAASFVLIGAGLSMAAAPTVVAVVLALLCVALFLLPAETLPLLALCCFALLPVNDLPLPSFTRAVSPGVVIFAVWLIRRGRGRNSIPVLTRRSASLLACYLLITTALTISLARSLVWSFAFVASVLLPILAGGFDDREARLIVKGLIVLATGLSFFAIVEYGLHSNPLFGHLYASAPFPVLQHWKTYRVTTTLGHPLNNALFFSAAATAAFAIYLETRHNKYLFAFVAALIGLFLTGSRGALYLTPVAIALVVIFHVKSLGLKSRSLGRLVLLLGVGGCISVALYAQTVGARASTGEAQSSTNVRFQDVPVSLSTAGHYHYIGSGPGTSNSAKNKSVRSVEASSLVIENSYLQLLVSIGIPGLVLVIVLFGSLIREGIRRQRLPAVGALVSMILVMSTFNFIEGVRPGLILLGLLAGACLARSDDASVSPAKRWIAKA